MKAHRSLALAAGVALLGASPVVAQRGPLLDLGGAMAPTPGSGRAALGLAAEMRAEAGTLEAAARTSRSAAARAEVRLLAAELASSGEALGPSGSSRVLVAWTIRAGLDELDAAIGALARGEGLGGEAGAAETAGLAWTAFLVEDLRAARAELASGAAEPWRVARNALGVLAAQRGAEAWTGPGAWLDEPGDGPTPAELWAMVRRMPGLNAGDLSAMEGAIDVLASAQDGGVRRVAAHRRAQIAAVAAVALDRPAGMSEASGEAWSRALATAMGEMAAGGPRGGARLESMWRWTELMRLARALPSDAAGSRVRASVLELASSAGEGTLADVGARGALLELAVGRGRLPEESTLPRPLRPVWRARLQAARVTEASLLSILPEAVGSRGALTDPGVLASAAGHRASLEELASIARAGRVMSAATAEGAREAAVDPAWSRVADRMARLAAEASRNERGAAGQAAQAALAELVRQVDRFGSMPGEAELASALEGEAGDAARAGWDAATGGRSAELRAEVLARRAAWLGALRGGATPAPAEVADLEAMRRLLGVLRDARAMAGVPARRGALEGLRGWPGFEASEATVEALSMGLVEATVTATGHVLGRRTDEATRALDALEREHVGALAVGRLARLHASARTAAGVRGADAVSALAAGGPLAGRSWMWRLTGESAALSRYAMELPGATGEQRTTVRRAMDAAARAVLAATAE